MILDLGGGACEEATALPGCGELLNVEGLLWYVLHQGSAFFLAFQLVMCRYPNSIQQLEGVFFGARYLQFQ